MGKAEESALTCTVLMRRSRLLCQLRPLFGPRDGWVSGIQALGHLFTDDVNEALKGLLHVDVVLSAGLEELKTWRGEMMNDGVRRVLIQVHHQC